MYKGIRFDSNQVFQEAIKNINKEGGKIICAFAAQSIGHIIYEIPEFRSDA